jgi:sterol desaturase/sphingolipid hydroxylase (fatty acid hydroxylase superfamily)
MPILESLLHDENPLGLMFWSTAYFLAIFCLFTGFAWLLAKGLHRPIERRAYRPGQLRGELLASLRSILLFGFGMALPWALVRLDVVHVEFSPSPLRIVVEFVILVLWNDLHFYAMHRLLHERLPKAHVWHHRSVTASPFASYSMSLTEAVLLGSVMPLAMLFHDFSALALLALPVWSLFINSLAHSNCDLFPRAGDNGLLAFVRHHQRHHSSYHGNYAFLFPVLDRWLGTMSPRAQRGKA